jgi:transposase-like protein
MAVLKEGRVADRDLENVRRWTARRRVALVLQIVKGETSAQEAARKHGLTLAEAEDWKEKFLSGAENALRSRPRGEEALKEEEIKRLKQKVGELVLDNDILREASKPYRPSEGRTSDE